MMPQVTPRRGSREHLVHLRLLVAAGLLLSGAAPAGCRGSAGEVAPRRGPVEVQGHRGCRGLRPENTMAAFEHAVALGVDALELDLGLSKDRILVVVHDHQINHDICDDPEELPAQRFKELTFDQIRTLDCGTRRNRKFPAQRPVPRQRIPRIEQVMDLLDRHPGLRANVEIKTFHDNPDWTHPPETFARLLVSVLKARGVLGRVVVQSFDPAALQAVARLEPRVALAALVERRSQFDAILQATGAKILSPRHTALRRGDVARYHARGVRVIPWTVNIPGRMRALIRSGVDGIITDRPDLLVPLVKR